ncbi:MAG: fatty-acyl-CoA synthase, partial [Arenicella sp.]
MHRPQAEPNLANTLLRRAASNPERTALIFEDQKISYQEFADRV